MDCIREKYDTSVHQDRVSLWMLENFGRAARPDEVDGAKIDNPIEIASKLQASPEQACDLWARMIRHAHTLHIVVNVDIDGVVINGEIIELWPRLNGHKVILCLFEGMNPKDSLWVLDGDPEATALLRQISDASLRLVLDVIREGREELQISYDFWLRALCDAEPLTEARIRGIQEEFDYSGLACDLISMIRTCQEGRWSIHGIDQAKFRQLLEALETSG